MRIEPDPLTAPDVVDFLQAHVTQMRSISPPESTHALDLEGLRSAEVRFYAAREDGELVGCGALKRLDDAHVEIKSMRTAPHLRGRGVATAILQHLLEEARALGHTRVSLETGAEDFFAPARRLYARHGFTECEPFGSYRPDPLSVFMTREL